MRSIAYAIILYAKPSTQIYPNLQQSVQDLLLKDVIKIMEKPFYECPIKLKFKTDKDQEKEIEFGFDGITTRYTMNDNISSYTQYFTNIVPHGKSGDLDEACDKLNL